LRKDREKIRKIGENRKKKENFLFILIKMYIFAAEMSEERRKLSVSLRCL